MNSIEIDEANADRSGREKIREIRTKFKLDAKRVWHRGLTYCPFYRLYASHLHGGGRPYRSGECLEKRPFFLGLQVLGVTCFSRCCASAGECVSVEGNEADSGATWLQWGKSARGVWNV